MSVQTEPSRAAPAREWLTRRDLRALFGRAVTAADIARWQAEHGFPMALPWSRREQRFNRAAVVAWKARVERACGSLS